MHDPVESDLRRYLKELEEADKQDEHIDNLTDEKWEQITEEVVNKLSRHASFDEEFTTSRTVKGKMVVESACCFAELITEHMESERLQRLMSDLIASTAGEQVRASLAQLHAAAHAHNLALAQDAK